MNGLVEIVTFFGRAICHQLQERSLMIDGQYLPICARDTGIYIGIFSTFAFLLFTKKYKTTTIPNIKNSFLLLFMLIPLVVDGLGSYMDFYETNNVIRIITGILFGIALPFFLVPLIHRTNVTKIQVPIISNFGEIVYPLILAATLGLFTYYSIFPFWVMSIILIGTLIGWFTLIVLVLFNQMMKRNYYNIFFAISGSLVILSILSFINEFIRPLYINSL